MKEKIFSVTVASPQDLQVKLSAEMKSARFDYTYIAISLTDPKVTVYPFHLPSAAHPQLVEQLKAEARELLSLKDGDIELDYQVFNKNAEMIDGLFLCIPRKLLEQYINICDHARLIPIHFTANILTCLGASFARHKGEAESFCILEFTRDNYVNLAVFCSNKCEFIRHIKNDSPSEVRRDVLQSIRSASAKSQIKDIEHIYIGGEAKEHQQLIAEIVNDTHAQVKQEEGGEPDYSGFDFRQNYFQANLAKNYSFALARRKQFFLVSHIVLGILGFFLLIGLAHLLIVQAKIAKIKTSFSAHDLKHARELKQQLDEPAHAN